MKYQMEYHPNPHWLSIHVDKQLTNEMIEMYESENYDKDKQPPFVQDIFTSVPGVTSVSVKKYNLKLVKGILFDWEEIIRKVTFILQMHLDPENEMKEAAAPMRYYIDREGYRRDMPQAAKDELHTSKLFTEENEGDGEIE